MLGYFGGGETNILEALHIAEQYAKSTRVDISSVCIDEILHSRRFKGFKYIFSAQKQKPEKEAHISDNVWEWLTD